MIDFSGPCFRNAFSLVVDEDEQRAAWEDFNNPETRIAVDAGSSHDSAVTRHCPDAQIVRLKSQSDATASVQAGRADAQCLVLILALTLVSKNKNIGKVVIPSPGDATTSNAGFRREEDPAWKDFVTGWIEEQRQSGFVRKAIIDNMALLGVTEEDFLKVSTFDLNADRRCAGPEGRSSCTNGISASFGHTAGCFLTASS
ncbi:hypothetical protein ACFSYD_23085 [Paracoccus aerius]